MAEAGLRYLARDDVVGLLPSLSERLAIARQALCDITTGTADVPPKLTLRLPNDALAEAMPGRLTEPPVIGIKWVTAYPSNGRIGISQVNALIILSDPSTGVPRWLLDGAAITTARTAAVSMAALEVLRHPNARRITVLGYGAQAKAHVEALGGVLEAVELTVHGPDAESADAFCRWAAHQPVVVSVAFAADVEEAIGAADVVLSCATLRPGSRALDHAWLQPNAAVIAIDDDTYVSPDLASRSTFVVDDIAQFNTYREGGTLSDFPDPVDSVGGLLRRGRDELMRAGGLAILLGTAAADLSLAAVVAQRAGDSGRGEVLAL